MVRRKTLFFLSLIVILFGCSNSGEKITTMKMLPATNEGLNFEPTSEFGVDDTIAILTEGCSDKNILVKVYDGKGEVVFSEETSMPKKAMDRGEAVAIKGFYIFVKMESKKSGNHSAVLYIDNKKVHSCDFVVMETVPYGKDSSDK